MLDYRRLILDAQEEKHMWISVAQGTHYAFSLIISTIEVIREILYLWTKRERLE